ncbi:MAG TPA: hypothetical protein PLC48_04465 [Ferruginibacter sp.]|jgi:ABC-type dipeptide/oligopeptide/nickel transport system permease subunit|nr:hypothetical protein [Ferruginibacter sp.]
MPESKKREAHKHPHVDYIPHKKKKGSAKMVTVIFCAFLSLAIAWFAAGTSPLWLLVGIVLGAGFGYFLGSQIDKSLNK